MKYPALTLFKSLDSFSKLQELIDNGEAEGLHLECKAPSAPQLTRELKAKLAEAMSGFSNTNGGVIIWGISTTRHAHSRLDVLTQIEPVGHCRKLAQQIDNAIPQLTYPVVQVPPSTVVYPSKGDSKGIVITYIPPTLGDPIQSVLDRKFYFRNGDEFAELPYEILKRLFTGTIGPDLTPVFDSQLVKLENNNQTWKIPIILVNNSSAASEHTQVVVSILNRHACATIVPVTFSDAAAVNPGKCIYIAEITKPIYRGLHFVVGEFIVQMKKERRSKRLLKLAITVYSSKMRAREWKMDIQLAKRGFSVKHVGDGYLY